MLKKTHQSTHVKFLIPTIPRDRARTNPFGFQSFYAARSEDSVLAGLKSISQSCLPSQLGCLRGIGPLRAGAELLPDHMDPALLMKQDILLEVFKDEQDAVNSFFPDRVVLTCLDYFSQ
jgi:hypothetical protein